MFNQIRTQFKGVQLSQIKYETFDRGLQRGSTQCCMQCQAPGSTVSDSSKCKLPEHHLGYIKHANNQRGDLAHLEAIMVLKQPK